MHHLTNYYKNLSEQLQQQLNLLVNVLNEAKSSKRKSPRKSKGVPNLKDLEAMLNNLSAEVSAREHDMSDRDARWTDKEGRARIAELQGQIRSHPEIQARMNAPTPPGFFSQRGEPLERTDTPEERGLNRGTRPLPPNVYETGRSRKKDR